MRRLLLSGFGGAALAVLFACGPHPSGLSLTGGSEVEGKLVDSASANVAGATVVVKRAADTVHIVKTVTSRTDGTFSVDSLPLDTYSLFASKTESGRLIVAFIPVKVDSSAPRGEPPVIIQTGTHVMLPPGSISGRVVLSYADSGAMAGIFVYIPGTSYIAMTNDTGGFTIFNVPPDSSYTVYYQSSGVPAYSTGARTGITVVSNRNTPLSPDTLRLSTQGAPPQLRGVSASYDTARGIVTLSWKKMPLGDLKEYFVVKKTNGAVQYDTTRDTFFVDTVFRDTSTGTTAITRAYQAGAIDSSGISSLPSEPPLEFVVIPPSLRPRGVQIVAADSTDSSVILRWNRSPDADFKQYLVYRREQRAGAQDALIYTSLRAADTSFTFGTLSNTAADYWVVVLNTEGFTTAGTPVRKSIRNSPPQFTTTLAQLPDSVPAGTAYSITLQAFDKNNDTLQYSVGSTAGGSVTGALFTWVPDIDQAGMQQCTLTVRDTHGGSDTIAWKVRVVVHGVWTDRDRDTLLGARRLFGIGVLSGSMYAVGGGVDKFNGTNRQLSALKTVERYDSAAKKWVAAAPLATARWAPFVAAANGKLYTLGGFSERSYAITPIEEYDPAGNAWTTAGQMPFTRADGAVCAIGARIYCIGGRTYDAASRSEVIVKSIDIYDVQAKTWSKGPDMTMARADLQAVVAGGKIYILGGIGAAIDSTGVSDGDALAGIEVYDPNAGTCSPAGSLNSPRCNFAAALYNGSVYLMGGFTSLLTADNIDSVMEMVSVPSLQIQLSTPGIEPRHSAQAATLGQGIYCVGGALKNDSVINRTVVFYP